MKAALSAFAFALGLAGCGTIGWFPPVAPEQPPPGTCHIDRLLKLVGRPATPELGAEAQRLSGAARLRFIRPGDVVTMEIDPQRLNIHLDAEDRIDHFICG
jgi:type VI protein secretion system component VasA